MADKIDRFAEDSYEKLKRKIRNVYREAALEVQRKLEDFTLKHEAKSRQLQARVEAGEIKKEDYQDWLRGQVFTGKRWKAKLDEITQTYVNADAKAREIVGDQDKQIFAYAANETAEMVDRHVKTAASFDIYDQKTVNRLMADNPQMLPEWKIDEKKDYIWNEKRVQNAITQGIIQGESIQKIGNRLTSELAASNAGKMQMFARTAVTGAHNAGRVERLKENEAMGITVLKKWLAVHDSRTREAHAFLDGQTRKPDEDFVDQDGNRIAYPGDPTADPALVYNCRCTLVYVYPEYERGDEESQEENGYQYHATKQSSLVGIAEKGLRPNRGHVGDGVYFADSVEDALEWTSETSTGGRTVLRVSEEYLKKGKLEKWAASETGYGIAESVYAGTIPLEFIEIRVNDNGNENDWWSLAEYLKNYKSKYSMLNKKTQREVDRIVEEEYKKRWK